MMVLLLLLPLLAVVILLPFCESFSNNNVDRTSLRIAKMTCTRYNDGHPTCCCYDGASKTTTKKKQLTLLQIMSSSNNNNNNNNNNDDEDGEENDDEIFFYDDFSGQSIGEVVGNNNNPLLEQQQDDKKVVDVVEDDALLLLPDFDDEDTKMNDNNSSREVISIPLPKQKISTINDDMTGSTIREFSFGPDVLLSNYAGSLGFDKVTDWQYYTTNEYTGEKQSVNPRPLDPTQPTRTRSSSGSVVRLFRGELGGLLGSKLRSRGLDGRVWIKEYSGTEALQLAQCEKRGLGKLQSSWLKQHLQQQKGTSNTNNKLMLQQMQDGEWIHEAQRRYVNGLTDTPTNKDDENLITLLELVSKQRAPFASLLGELNLNDYWDDDESEYSNNNEWYKSLGVKPPRPGSVWLIFDYHGISTAASYAVPSIIQRSKLPPKRGPFGGVVEAPPLPPFKERARYMVQGVLKGMLSAVASAHEAGIVHRSIGRNSFILSSVGQDKREATSPYAVVLPRLRVILSDFGFSAPVEEAMLERELGVRSRMFGIPGVAQSGSSSNDRTLVASGAFTMAEDLHALGFVFLALLFTTLSEPATLSAPMPPTDDDAWQRLFFEIFDKDMDNFRDYCANEEVWDNVVELLDRENGAGWDLLGDLLLARERLGEWYNDNEREGMILDQTAKGLLSHPFFQMKII